MSEYTLMEDGEYLKWDACPLECAWDFNPPICARPECPVIPVKVTVIRGEVVEEVEQAAVLEWGEVPVPPTQGGNSRA